MIENEFCLEDLRNNGWIRHATRFCCNREYFIRAFIARNGNYYYKLYCLECQRVCSGHLPHFKINDNLKSLLKAKENGDYESLLCEHCNSNEGVERHHWAPKSVFGDKAYDWPTSYLCRTCHRFWHEQMAKNNSHFNEQYWK